MTLRDAALKYITIDTIHLFDLHNHKPTNDKELAKLRIQTAKLENIVLEMAKDQYNFLDSAVQRAKHAECLHGKSLDSKALDCMFCASSGVVTLVSDYFTKLKPAFVELQEEHMRAI